MLQVVRKRLAGMSLEGLHSCLDRRQVDHEAESQAPPSVFTAALVAVHLSALALV